MRDEAPPAAALRAGRGLFFVLAAGLLVVLPATIGRLPPVVASHFDAHGAPNGWSSRAVYGGLILLIGVVLPLGIVWLVHAVTRQAPSCSTFRRGTTGGGRSTAPKPCAARGRTCGGWPRSWRASPWPCMG
jgi:Protein of unknown function (DUF1648)